MDSAVREAMRETVLEFRLLKQIVKDLKMLFECSDENVKNLEQLEIWYSKENVAAGRNFTRML